MVLILVGVLLGGSMFINSQRKPTPTSVPAIAKVSPTPTTAQTSSQVTSWHINNTSQWAIYSNPDTPITIQYPPQWRYFEITQVDVAGVTKIVPAQGVIFAPVSDLNETEGINIDWGGGGHGGPSKCIDHRTIQFKNEARSACEYIDNRGVDSMQIELNIPNYRAYIRASSSTSSKELLLKILSTLSFTK